MKEILPPNSFDQMVSPSIFLAGSIDMGVAPNWQAEVVKDLEPFNGTILNPRRLDWDSSWIQSASNPNFSEQVNWELDGLGAADIILMHFAPATLAPISFGEFSAHYMTSKMFVSCPKGWWKRGNVEVMCERAGIKLYESLEEAVTAIIEHLKTAEYSNN